MNREILSFMNLTKVAGNIQTQAWEKLSGADYSVVTGLTSRQIKALMAIYTREMEGLEAYTLNELGEALGMKKATASILVSELADKCLIDRNVDPDNRRYIRIEMSEEGKRIRDSVISKAQSLIQEIYSDLSDAEVRQFTRIAEKIYQIYVKKCGGES